MQKNSSAENTESQAQRSNLYSDKGTANIYELARFFIENGDTQSAEIILKGLLAVNSSYGPAWLALGYIHIINVQYNEALHCVERSIKVAPELKQALLYQANCHLALRDLSAAGTVLGEIGELIESGEIVDTNSIRFYKMLMARFQG